MKRNRTLLIGLFTFALVCASLTFVGSTYAKYTSEINSADTIQAAKYAWTVEGVSESDPINAAKKFEFNAVKLAPGYGESITVDVINESDVDLAFTLNQSFTFALSGNKNPIKYSYTIESTSTKYVYGKAADNFASIETAFNPSDEFILEKGAKATITIILDWPFEVDADGNTNDTAIGRLGATATWSVSYKLTAVQMLNQPNPLV